MNKAFSGIQTAAKNTRASVSTSYGSFRKLGRGTQAILVVGALLLIGGIVVLTRGGSTVSTNSTVPTVTVQSISSFGGNSNGVDVLGTVRSVSEADILAQSAGTVKSVKTTIGASVPAGFVIASLDGSAASASVLQAQGGYDAAVAASKSATLQAQNIRQSLPESKAAVENLYESDYTTLNGVINNDVYQLFGDNTPVGPGLLINPLTTNDTLPRELRTIIDTVLPNWEASISTETTTDPKTLLSNAQSYLTTVSLFLSDLDDLAGTQGSAATAAQLAAVSTAQTSVNSLLSNISVALTTYNSAQTAGAVSETQASNSSSNGVTSAQASVEQALGSLRAAQAAYEKTVIRAPIAGTVNFLPIHVGDYASQNEHVATVARNNALEVVLVLSQKDANRLAVGDKLIINSTDKGVVTTISPALDPITKQIEVHVAVNDGVDLVNGQSVQVVLPTLPTESGSSSIATTTKAQTTASTTPSASIELPLTAVKLLPNERDVFSVDSTGHLVAHQVQIGDVIGDRIQIITSLDPSLEIITDARGLSAGDAVLVSTSTEQ